MLLTGLILCYLLGISLLLTISRKYSLAELFGYSFLLGMGVETFFLFFLDVVGITYSTTVLIGLNVFFIAAINGINYKNLLLLKDEFKMPSLGLKNINPVAIFIFCILLYLLYAVTVKCLFWPSTEHDTIGSFDKLGRIMAHEGKLKISLFQWNLQGAAGIYPPLFHAAFAYAYIFGAETAKIITTLFFVSMLFSFYGGVNKYVDSTASMFFTFLFMITPELFSHAALSLGNMPATAYVCAGALATFRWLDKHESKYFWLGAIFMGFVLWIRSDAIGFPVAALFIVGIDFLKTKDWKRTIVYGVIAISPFIIWNLYLKFKIGNVPSNKFDLGIGYNADRMHTMMGYVKAYLFGHQHGNVDGGQLYGVTFVLFFVLLLINLGLMFKVGIKKLLLSEMNVLLFFFVSFALYFTVFYLIDEKVQAAPIPSLMESSFKRGMFCFVPIALFYCATNWGSAWVFEKIEKYRTIS